MASTHYIREMARRARERSKLMNSARWKRDRERRDKLAAMEPLNYPGTIVRRIIVIDRESEVREAVLFDTDSIRDARRKLRAVLTTTATRP